MLSQNYLSVDAIHLPLTKPPKLCFVFFEITALQSLYHLPQIFVNI